MLAIARLVERRFRGGKRLGTNDWYKLIKKKQTGRETKLVRL